MQHLRVFSLVAKLNSVSGAAREVHLSKSAVTQAVAKLEERFASSLFLRHRKGMYCTRDGDILLRRTERAFAELDRGLAAIRTNTTGSDRDLWRAVSATQLRAAAAIACNRNLYDAAGALGVSQSLLIRALRDLESAVGVTLFEIGATVILTRNGRAFTRHAAIALREIELAEHDINAARGAGTGRIAIGSTPSSHVYLIPQAINRFTKRHPEMRISLVDGSYETLLTALRTGQVDFVITAHRRLPTDDVIEERLFTDQLYVVARGDHPLARKPGLVLLDLAEYPWIVSHPGTPARTQYDRLLRRAGGTKRGILEMRSFVCMRSLLLESDYLALLSRRQLEYEAEGRFAILPVDLPGTKRTVGLITRRDWQMSGVQADLVAEMRSVSRELRGS